MVRWLILKFYYKLPKNNWIVRRRGAADKVAPSSSIYGGVVVMEKLKVTPEISQSNFKSISKSVRKSIQKTNLLAEKSPTNDTEKTLQLQKEEDLQISRKEIENAKETLNKTLEALEISVKVEIDDTADKMVIKVIDKKTGKVLREHPPEILLKFYRRMREALGLVIDDLF